MLLGDVFPDFEAETSIGKLKFWDWSRGSWTILFSHPADYTPVCTTELARVAKLTGEFAARNIKVIALSIDSAESHLGWIKDIKKYGGLDESADFPFPIIADENRQLATQFGMLDPNEISAKTGLPLTARTVFVIDQDHKLRLSLLYPATTGRSFDEILRAVDSLLLTEKFKVATPADWKVGDKCMVQPSVPDADLATLFPNGVERVEVPSGKGYIRLTPQPDAK
ncbi:peroxiredoxin-6-like [Neocloeon triangulifer]|uniref:peroxiredoxin-6-like n=1 Tax=Neocloeon triangulifer TaxID=2078957 RepID=UPI00286EE2DE|nr:peroxiredoxin-6-like [Neocloeon triangulifer]